MDYKRFLKTGGDVETIVLPYFGGTRVDARDRRYWIRGEVNEPGWWRFEIDRRDAIPRGVAEPIALDSLPAVRGHYVGGWVVVDGRARVCLAIAPADEPEVLSRVVARRWYSGDCVFDCVDFDDAAEAGARAALEERAALSVKGVTPGLRTAYGCAVGLAVAEELQVETSVPEVMAIALELADGGGGVMRELFAEVAAERAAQRAAVAALVAARARAEREASVVRGAKVIDRDRRPQKAADAALDGAQARMVSARLIQGGALMDVTYTVDGVRIISTVDSRTLQVVDAGICLAGADRVLTLDAMPSVVREAVIEDHLNITRRS